MRSSYFNEGFVKVFIASLIFSLIGTVDVYAENSCNADSSKSLINPIPLTAIAPQVDSGDIQLPSVFSNLFFYPQGGGSPKKSKISDPVILNAFHQSGLIDVQRELNVGPGGDSLAALQRLYGKQYEFPYHADSKTNKLVNDGPEKTTRYNNTVKKFKNSYFGISSETEAVAAKALGLTSDAVKKKIGGSFASTLVIYSSDKSKPSKSAAGLMSCSRVCVNTKTGINSINDPLVNTCPAGGKEVVVISIFDFKYDTEKKESHIIPKLAVRAIRAAGSDEWKRDSATSLSQLKDVTP